MYTLVSEEERPSTQQYIATARLEEKLHKCAKKHVHHFKDLTAFNIHKKAAKIEELRKELLLLVQQTKERSHYAILEQTLITFDINKPFRSIPQFKKIIQVMPSKTRTLLKKTIDDFFVKKALGL